LGPTRFDGTQVRLVSPSGTHERVLLDGTSFEDVNGVAWEHYVAPIAWAPHGDELAVAAALLEQDGADDGDHVRVAKLAGGTSRTLPLFANSGLDWSPDGKSSSGSPRRASRRFPSMAPCRKRSFRALGL